MQTTIKNWEGTDAELLVALNAKTNKKIVNDGLVSLPMVAAVSEQLAGMLVVTLKRTVAALEVQVSSLADGAAKDTTEGQLEIIRSFFLRLTESSYGAPIDSDSFRTQFAGVATQAGWDAASIEAFLSLGAVMTSPAFDALGRDAVQSDLDTARVKISEDLARESLDAAQSGVNARANAAIEAAIIARALDSATAETITAAANTAWGA